MERARSDRRADRSERRFDEEEMGKETSKILEQLKEMEEGIEDDNDFLVENSDSEPEEEAEIFAKKGLDRSRN